MSMNTKSGLISGLASPMAGRQLSADEPLGLNSRAPTSADANVGVRIKQLRRAAGRTQKQIASAIGVTGAQFHRYETGATRVAASRLLAIAAALGTRPEALIGLQKPPSPPPQLDGTATDDLVELVEAYTAISDPRRRHALIAFARVVARGPLPDEIPLVE